MSCNTRKNLQKIFPIYILLYIYIRFSEQLELMVDMCLFILAQSWNVVGTGGTHVIRRRCHYRPQINRNQSIHFLL